MKKKNIKRNFIIITLKYLKCQKCISKFIIVKHSAHYNKRKLQEMTTLASCA